MWISLSKTDFLKMILRSAWLVSLRTYNLFKITILKNWLYLVVIFYLSEELFKITFLKTVFLYKKVIKISSCFYYAKYSLSKLNFSKIILGTTYWNESFETKNWTNNSHPSSYRETIFNCFDQKLHTFCGWYFLVFQKYKWCPLFQNPQLICIFQLICLLHSDQIQNSITTWTRNTFWISWKIQVVFSKNTSGVLSSKIQSCFVFSDL